MLEARRNSRHKTDEYIVKTDTDNTHTKKHTSPIPNRTKGSRRQTARLMERPADVYNKRADVMQIGTSPPSEGNNENYRPLSQSPLTFDICLR